MLLSLCFTTERKYEIEIAWEGKIFALVAFLELILLFVIDTILMIETITRSSGDHNYRYRHALFYEVGLYLVAAYFFFQAFRGINKESKIDLHISVGISLFIAIWLTFHVVQKEWYDDMSGLFFKGVGVFLTSAAWVCFLILVVLGHLALKRFGFRAYYKVGGLRGSQNVYVATASFRSLLRLDIVAVFFCCYTGWFYVYDGTPGLIGCMLFFFWTFTKDITMLVSIKKGITTHTRILRLTSFDIFVAFVATLASGFDYYGVNFVKNNAYIYAVVGTAAIVTRVLLCLLTRRALDEVTRNKERAESLLSN